MLHPDSAQYNTCCTYNAILKKNIREAKGLHYEQLFDKYKFKIEIVDRITTHLNNNQLPISIFLDLSKAFGTLDQTILLQKV